MTNIKCSYSMPYCMFNNTRVYHGEYWWCDTNDGCETGDYERPDGAPLNLANPICKYCEVLRGEFEKNVKRYEYKNGCLLISGMKLFEDDIDYLEIDGRVLVAKGHES